VYANQLRYIPKNYAAWFVFSRAKLLKNNDAHKCVLLFFREKV